MRNIRLLISLALVGFCTVLTGCGYTSPNVYQPVALKVDQGGVQVAFCEETFVGRISVEQRTSEDRRVGDFPLLFRGEVNQVFEVGDVLTLNAENVGFIEVDKLASISPEEGTWIFVGVVSGPESGFVGHFTVGEEGWPRHSWLPTQSEPTETPCEFWEEWTN